MSDIHDHLDALRQGQTDIECALYVDMRSGTVLSASGHIQQPQERLDRICEITSQTLDGPWGQQDRVLLVQSTETLCFCRSDQAPAEALSLICIPDADVTAIMGRAQAMLNELGRTH